MDARQQQTCMHVGAALTHSDFDYSRPLYVLLLLLLLLRQLSLSHWLMLCGRFFIVFTTIFLIYVLSLSLYPQSALNLQTLCKITFLSLFLAANIFFRFFSFLLYLDFNTLKIRIRSNHFVNDIDFLSLSPPLTIDYCFLLLQINLSNYFLNNKRIERKKSTIKILVILSIVRH